MDTYNMIDFNKKKGFICDMDGVIYHGNRVLPGVVEFIQWLHDEDLTYRRSTSIRARLRRRPSCAIRRRAARSLPSARRGF